MSARSTETADPGFSLAQDPPLRLQRLLRLAPRSGFGAFRRAFFFATLTWLPIMVWGIATGQFQTAGEIALRPLSLHVRCLIAIPLFILSGPLADRVVRRIVTNFEPSGLILSQDRDRFAAAVRSIERWRDSRIVWLALAGLVALVALTREGVAADPDALGWTVVEGTRDFGSLWAQCVARPIFLFLLLAWLWRLLLTYLLFRRISKLDLQLVPSHPDRVGGLGFTQLLPVAFTLVILALSCIVCEHVAHQILSHGAKMLQFKALLGCWVVLVAGLFLSPLAAFASDLRRVRLQARFEYGTLAGRHVRGLHTRWVEGRAVDDDILAAPEIGPAADVATLYDMAIRMRVVPIGKETLVAVLVPALVPVLIVATIEVPLKEILLKIFNALA